LKIPQYWEFRHPSFTADQKHSLENIKRKITTNKKPETPTGGALGTPVSGAPGGGSANSAAAGSNGVVPATSEEIQHLDRQIRILSGNQKGIEMHLDRFSAQYQVGFALRLLVSDDTYNGSER
jgi:osomolarity two-component system response regulator SKN7